MIEFFVMALVAYLAAGNKDRRTASKQALGSARTSGRTAARNTWSKTRPAKRTPSGWWTRTPARRTVLAGGRAARTGAHFGLAGLLAGLAAFWAGSRTAAGEWRSTRRGQRQQKEAELPADPTETSPEQVQPIPGQPPEQTSGQPQSFDPANPWGDPQPIRRAAGQGGGQPERFRLDVHLEGAGSPTSSGGFASRLPKAEAIARAEQWAKSSIMVQLRRDDVGVLYRITGGGNEQIGSYRGHQPLPDDPDTDETTTTPRTTHAKEAAMTTGPADISDLTTHIKELEDFYQELSEGEIWPVIEAWAAGSDLLSRDLGSDTHAATDEVASSAQAMLDGREVILDAVEYAIQEAKTTVGDAA